MTETGNRYQPGICNIGGEEISKRKKELAAGLVVTFGLTTMVYFKNDTWLSWALLFFSACFSALMYFQVKSRFCVVFGLFGLYNFGKRGKPQKANDPNAIARDRKKVMIMSLQTLAVGSVYTCLAFLAIRVLLP